MFMPHISIVFAIIFLSGLIGGAAYVNVFSRIHEEVYDFSGGSHVYSNCLISLCKVLYRFLEVTLSAKDKFSTKLLYRSSQKLKNSACRSGICLATGESC